MEQRISFVTLGVRNLTRAKEFYAKLGWKPHASSQGDVVFYQAGGMVFALYPWKLLAEDAHTKSAGTGFRGVALAYNVKRKKDVAATLAKAKRAGAKIVKEAQDVFWGGHSGYFRDTEGHLWEVAYNPFVTLQKDGSLFLGK